MANTDLVDPAERYHLIGVYTEEREDNRDLPPGSEPDSQKVAGEVVYTTNSKDEANRIAKAGGFQREGGPWIAVQGWRDTQTTSGAGADTPQPLKRPS